LALAVLKMVTKWATRQGIIARDPAEYVVSPKAKPVNRVAAQDIWTPMEMLEFISFVKSSHRLWACYLLSAYGLRRSEVCGLRWSDVDIETGTLSIEQGFVEVDGQTHVVGAPKSERSRRTLPLPEEVATALHDLRAQQRRESLAHGIGWSDARHVCSDEDGTTVLPRTYSRQFAAMVKDAGLRPIILRNLRHTSVSVMLHDGVPPSTVAAWHGRDVRMTDCGLWADLRRGSQVRSRGARTDRRDGVILPAAWDTLGPLGRRQNKDQVRQPSDLVFSVELRGLEPLTPTLPVWCATSCAIAPYSIPSNSRTRSGFTAFRLLEESYTT